MTPSKAATGLKRLRQQAKLSVREVAEAIGRPASTYSSYEDKYKKPYLPLDLVKDLGPIFIPRGVDQSALFALAGINDADAPPMPAIGPSSPDGFIPIGRFDTSLSMGPGALALEEPEPLGYWMFEAQWLRTLSQAAASQLGVVKVDGDSMQPTLLAGDWVLIDRTQTRLSREGIYAIRVGDDAWVKRLSLNLKDRTVRIISDNATIPFQDISMEEIDVIGRVVSIVARKIP